MHKLLLLHKLKISLILFSWGIVVSSLVQASTGAEFLRLDVPARAGALAAGTADQGGSDVLIWNPAGIIGQQAPALSLTHFSAFDEFAYEQLAAVLPGWLGGTWGVRFFYSHSFDFVELDDQGQSVGAIEYHDALLHLTYARKWGPYFASAVSLKAFQSQLSEYSSIGGAVDIGLHYQTPWEPLVIGMAVQNLGVRTAFIDEADPLPMLLLGGIAVTVSLITEQQLKLLLDINQLLNNGEKALISAGLEYGLYNIFFLRGGYRFEEELGRFSVGAGIKHQGLGLDYAYQPLSDLGDSHRFTLSYCFLTAQKLKAEPKPFVPKKLKTRIRELKILPRKFESVIMFKTPHLKANVREWQFEVREYSGKLVKTLTGVGKPPEYVKWDGRNQDGKIVVRQHEYQFAFKTGDKAVAKQKLPAFHPVVKLRFSKKCQLVPEVQFETKSRPDIKKWSLDIIDNKSRKVIRTLTQNKPLPEKILWDGKDKRGFAVDTQVVLSYILSVVYPDNTTISISERIRPVSARSIKTDPREFTFVIPGVLFDFNSAALKPEMMDKIMAAIQVLQRNQDTVRLVCEGYSDDVGGREYNEKLSRQRAEMVSNFILKKVQLPEDRVSEVGYGKKYPISKAKTETSRAKNRRVEIKISLPKPQNLGH